MELLLPGILGSFSVMIRMRNRADEIGDGGSGMDGQGVGGYPPHDGRGLRRFILECEIW